MAYVSRWQQTHAIWAGGLQEPYNFPNRMGAQLLSVFDSGLWVPPLTAEPSPWLSWHVKTNADGLSYEGQADNRHVYTGDGSTEEKSQSAISWIQFQEILVLHGPANKKAGSGFIVFINGSMQECLKAPARSWTPVCGITTMSDLQKNKSFSQTLSTESENFITSLSFMYIIRSIFQVRYGWYLTDD